MKLVGANGRSPNITRKLCTLTMEGGASIYGGAAISTNGAAVARLRSGGYRYTIGKNIGSAYLPFESAREGTDLSAQAFSEKIAARVEADVLYDAKGEKIKA